MRYFIQAQYVARNGKQIAIACHPSRHPHHLCEGICDLMFEFTANPGIIIELQDLKVVLAVVERPDSHKHVLVATFCLDYLIAKRERINREVRCVVVLGATPHKIFRLQLLFIMLQMLVKLLLFHHI